MLKIIIKKFAATAGLNKGNENSCSEKSWKYTTTKKNQI